MWKDSIRNIVVIFQPNILRIFEFYVRRSAPASAHGSGVSKHWSGTYFKLNLPQCDSVKAYLLTIHFNDFRLFSRRIGKNEIRGISLSL